MDSSRGSRERDWCCALILGPGILMCWAALYAFAAAPSPAHEPLGSPSWWRHFFLVGLLLTPGFVVASWLGTGVCLCLWEVLIGSRRRSR